MSTPAAKHPLSRVHLVLAFACGLTGFVLFQFFGNATRGYVNTPSVFWWWISQWLNPTAETQHGWLVLGLSGWVWWRNAVAIADRGLRMTDGGAGEGGRNRKLETGDRKAESGRTAGAAVDSIAECGSRIADRDPVRDAESGGWGPEGRKLCGGDATVGARDGSANPQSAIRNPQSIMPALAAMLVALALHSLGFAAQQTRVSIIALLIFIWGVVRLVGGRRAGQAALFPLAFLIFAIPFSALDEVGLPLRLWVTSAGEYIARGAGIEVLRSGTQLVAPDGRFNYDVAAPCSGVRSLVALAALSTLIGYLSFRTWTRRVLVLALCLPLVYLGNVARIVAIVFAAQWGGPQWGERAHEVMGYGVFIIVLGGVLGAVSALRRCWPEPPLPPTFPPLDDTSVGHLHLEDNRQDRGSPRQQAQHSDAHSTATKVSSPESSAKPREESSARAKKTWGGAEQGVGLLDVGERGAANAGTPRSGSMEAASAKRVAAVISIVVLAIAEMFFLRGLAHATPRGEVGVMLAADGQNPIELPAFLGSDWIGQRAEVSVVERETLPADTGFSRRNYAFVADRKRDVFLSIVLSGRDRTSIHRPELCLVGQGWTIEAATRHTFRYATSGDVAAAGFPAAVLHVRREVATPRGKIVVPQLVSYWFVGGDTVVSSHWKRFVVDAWNRVVRGRVDRWAYVLLQTDATDGEAAALARMQTVLDGTLPVFQRPFPSL